MVINPDMDMDMAIDPPILEEDSAPANPSGTKTLKAINKHLKALEAKLTTTTTASSSSPDQITYEIISLRSTMSQLQTRLECDELRASIRHNMLFNALVKVSTDVGMLSGMIQQVQEQQQVVDGQGQNDGADADGSGENNTTNGASVVNGTPRVSASVAAAVTAAKDKRGKAMRQSRKTYEQCLGIYTEDMNRAGDREGVEKYGGLCVQYAGDLFKTLG
jgi:hypothetical protein